MRKVILFPVVVLLLIQRRILWVFNRLFYCLTKLFGKMGEGTDASIIHLCQFTMRGERSD